MNNNISLLIKPASYNCNLKCDYCFYLEKSVLYPRETQLRMSMEILEVVIKKFLQIPQAVYSFGWQGGEPTLMGVEFYKDVVKLQEKYNVNNGLIYNALQTNATLLNDEFARFFSDNNFLLGCSIDGGDVIHNTYRHMHDSKPSYDSVVRGIQLLNEYGVDYNVLTLVSKANVEHAKEVYSFLMDNNHTHQQYIPCVEFSRNGELKDFAISGKEWGQFLCGIFDEWYSSGLNTAVIRNFDSIIKLMLTGTSDICTMSQRCDHYLVVEHNGDIYPCDFFVESSQLLGNINFESIPEIVNSNKFERFASGKNQCENKCKACKYFRLCFGGCPKNRIPGTNKDAICEGMLEFFDYSLTRFQIIAKKIHSSSILCGS